MELSPFVVDGSDDAGYRATNTLTGSRLNTSLRDTAASISVFTEEFLEDTGLTDVQEIALYSVSMVNNTQELNNSPNINNFLGAANPTRRVRIRGVRGTKGTDYFESFVPDDSYRADRYDESRGPNGILFGISNAGGIINTSLLRAHVNRDSGQVRYSFGSYGRSRADVRFNKVLIDDTLAIAGAALHQENESWRQYDWDDRERYYGTITWKPTDRLSLRAKFEDGKLETTRVRPFSASDRFLPWFVARNKFGVDAVTFAASDTSGNNPNSSERTLGVDTITGRNSQGTTRRRWVFNANDSMFYNTAGQWETVGNEDDRVASLDTISAASTAQEVMDAGGSGVEWDNPQRIVPEVHGEYGFPWRRELNVAGPGFFRNEDFRMYTLEADLRISENLFFNISHNHQENAINAQLDSGSRPEIRGDPNRLLRNPDVADFGGNDPTLLNPRAGQLYIESEWRAQEHNIDYDETRVALSYDLDFNDSMLGHHRFALGGAYRETSDQLLGQRFGVQGAPYDFSGSGSTDFDDSRNRLWVRTYFEAGDLDSIVADPPPEGMTFVDDTGVTRTAGYVNQDPGTQNARSDIEVDSYIAAMQNWFWNERIVTTFGWREDRADNTAFGHVLDPDIGFVITGDPTAPGYREDDTIKATTETAGVVFHMTQNFSLIANHSTSIGLPEFRNIVFPDEGIPPPVQGETFDAGIAFNFMENKISGRITYFDMESLNRSSSGGGTRIISRPMLRSMQALDQVREIDATIIRNPETGAPYTDAEWEQTVDELNGGVGGGFNPVQVSAFLQDNFSEGYELSLTANVTENWRLSLNASYTDRLRQNLGREFEKAAGWTTNEDGRLLNPITVDSGEDEAIAVDRSVLTPGSIHDRILEIAENAQGTIPLEDGTTRTINPGEGALLFARNDITEPDFDPEDTIAYMLWESLDGNNSHQIRKFERQQRWGLSPWKFNVFTAYDFSEGKLDGFTIGGGYRWLEGAIIGNTSLQPPFGEEFTSPDRGVFDLLLRYRHNLPNDNGRMRYQLNVYNVFDDDDPEPVRHVVEEDPSTTLSRFKYHDPVTVRATVTWNF